MFPSRIQYQLISFAVAASLLLGACQSDGDLLVPTSDSAAEPGPGPANNAVALSTTQRILFISIPNGGGAELYKVDPQGGNRDPIISADEEGTAAWSWDNKRIAVVRGRQTGNGPQQDIYLINADGTQGHWASATPSIYPVSNPSWSPDGSRLVVHMWVQGYAYLGWMNVATGQLVLFNGLQGGVSGSEPSYNAAGTKIIYVGPNQKTLEQINADGSNHKVRFSSTTNVHEPSFSPDGKKIAFTREVGTGSNTEIFVKNYADGSLKRLTSNAYYDTHPSWSPDGTRLAFTSDRSGRFQIWTMNATTGGSPTRITNTNYMEVTPAWSH